MRFSVGDRVKVVKNSNPEWDSYAGKTGVITRVGGPEKYHSKFPYGVDLDGGFIDVGFVEEELELIKPTVLGIDRIVLGEEVRKSYRRYAGLHTGWNAFTDIWNQTLETYPDAKEYKIHISVEAVEEEEE